MAKRKKSHKKTSKGNGKKGPKAWGKNLYGEGIAGSAGMFGGAVGGAVYGPEAVQWIADQLGMAGIQGDAAWTLATQIAGGLIGAKAGQMAGKHIEKEVATAGESVQSNGKVVDEGIAGAAGLMGGAVGGAMHGPQAVNWIATKLGHAGLMGDPAYKLAAQIAGGLVGGKLGSMAGRRVEDEVKRAHESTTIARFVKCLNEKNYAGANKYLKAIVEEKMKNRITSAADKY